MTKTAARMASHDGQRALEDAGDQEDGDERRPRRAGSSCPRRPMFFFM
ncbi:MAG: hypothetical protein M0C28_38120 [Candidatus Moduliflexus flocculans]|nr:hypothetical protein [Candidatus Moduliflexus flocculans]